MRFSLIPREMRFFDMLDEAAAAIKRSAAKFLEMLTKFDNLAARAEELKADEENCDAIVERILKALDLSFITPFDREDIHTLATNLDDVLDNLEESAHRFAVFRLPHPTPEAITLARLIFECCEHLEQAIHLSRNLKHHEAIHKHLLEIGHKENEADTVYRTADAALFANANGHTDILMLIKLRETYGWLEETVDACKDVANVISEIVIKGS